MCRPASAKAQVVASAKGSEAKKGGGLIELLIGAGGIYSAFLFYGVYQEAIFHFKAAGLAHSFY